MSSISTSRPGRHDAKPVGAWGKIKRERVMARIGFIGLGNMGLPMAQNLVKAGHAVRGFDVTNVAVERANAAGVGASGDLAQCVRDADLVLTMLPEGRHVRSAYLDAGGVLAMVPPAVL